MTSNPPLPHKKILVIALARLGDIFLSWPALRGLKRRYPQCHIHVLTRTKFKDALDGLDVVDKVIEWPTEQLLEPLFHKSPQLNEALYRLEDFLQNLTKGNLDQESYDWIVNFSFSPLSSYLTSNLVKRIETARCHSTSRLESSTKVKVSGYTRTTDGFLSIPDDISAYFFAQVGVQRPNRFHLAEIFASMVEVDLIEQDWSPPLSLMTQNQKKNLIPSVSKKSIPHRGEDSNENIEYLKKTNKNPYICVHIGSSQSRKTFSPEKWSHFVDHLIKNFTGSILLIGSKEEKKAADIIASRISSNHVDNSVGKTTLSELFSIIQKASLLIGADSSPMHMASLTGTPCLNISLATVNFWETGPRSPGSWVLRISSEKDISSEDLTRMTLDCMDGKVPNSPHVLTTRPRGEKSTAHLPCYQGSASIESLMSFEWNLIQALYMESDFPAPLNPLFERGIKELSAINQLIMEQLESIAKGVRIKNMAPILDRGDQVIDAIGSLVEELQPLVRWYKTEKIRILPNEISEIVSQTLNIHRLMQSVLNLYTQWSYHNQNSEDLNSFTTSIG